MFAGSSIPTERGDADGVRVVETEREEEWDGGLVLAGPQLLGPRGDGALARHAWEQGRADPALARPHRLLIHVTNGCNLHLGYNRFLPCERSFAIPILMLERWSFLLVDLVFVSHDGRAGKVEPQRYLRARSCWQAVFCYSHYWFNCAATGNILMLIGMARDSFYSLLITSSLDSANWTVWMYLNRSLILQYLMSDGTRLCA